MKMKEGDVLRCEVKGCEVEVTVTKGCLDECDLVCCGQMMAKKEDKPKAEGKSCCH